MRWKEVKILCAGMCICTVVSFINSREGGAWEQSRENFVQSEIEMSDSGRPDTGIEEIPMGETGTEETELEPARIEVTKMADTENGIDAYETEEAGMGRHFVYEVGTGAQMNTEAEGQMEETDMSLKGTDVNEESNLIIADVTNYVNIRSLPSEEGEILGKLYDDSVGRKHGEENGWYYIQSGSVIGYVKADYVLTGAEALQRAEEVGTRLAEVTTTTLKVRKEPTIESSVLGLVPGGDVLGVLEEVDGWVKVDVEEGTGYISTDYARVYTENVEAESREEEAARLKKEEEARKKAEEAAKEALRQQQANLQAKPNTSAGKPGTNSDSQNKNETGNSPASNEAGTADVGRQIADYAMKFIGNPYVYGGTSLTDGADCSGFVQSVYKHFGISLPRTSGEQGSAGRAVDGLNNARPGDLVWYSGHIGIYIGDGKIVHASSPKNGIITSNATYRTILGIRRIV